MALVWQHQQDDVKYEVRQAGNSLRLYTNGAFHTQYNSRYLFTGAIWDLLSLPTLCLPDYADSVLLLGVGGGTAIHQLDQLHSIQRLIGVDIDPLHLEIARKQFGVTYSHTNLVCDDALAWLRKDRRRHTVVIDDVFQHSHHWVNTDDPYRPHNLDKSWFDLLDRRTSSNGMIIQNHIDTGSARSAARYLKAAGFTLLTFTNEGYDNEVIAAFRSEESGRILKRRMIDRLEEMPRRETSRLRFNCRVSQ